MKKQTLLFWIYEEKYDPCGGLVYPCLRILKTSKTLTAHSLCFTVRPDSFLARPTMRDTTTLSLSVYGTYG